MNNDDQAIGRNLRTLRAAAGLSQTALAAAMIEAGHADWSQKRVSRIEHGQEPLQPAATPALQKILGPGFAPRRHSINLDDHVDGLMGLLGDQMVKLEVSKRLTAIEAAIGEVQLMVDQLRGIIGDPDYDDEGD